MKKTSQLKEKEFSKADWEILISFRNPFLENTAGKINYWNSSRAIELYHEVYAQRIAWKWQWVLNDLQGLNYNPIASFFTNSNATINILDFGCGTGIASLEFLKYISLNSLNPNFQNLKINLSLIDKSKEVREFAKTKILALGFKNISINFDLANSYSIVLVSHVVNELDTQIEEKLFEVITKSQKVFFVEPGTFFCSRKLISIREKLKLAGFNIIAPCLHQESCGLLTENHKKDWCHFFAKMPNERATSVRWRQIQENLKLDLKNLPLSFLILDKQEKISDNYQNFVRIIGNFKALKKHYLLSFCNESGVANTEISERKEREFYKELRRGKVGTVREIEK